MKHQKILTRLSAAAVALMTLTSYAQTFFLKDNNTNNLTDGASWVGGSTPGFPALDDVATWDSTVTTPAYCTNVLGGDVTWSGIQISNPAVSVKIVTNDLANGVGVRVGYLGITLTNSASLWVAPRLMTVGNQVWTIGAGRVLTAGEANRTVDVNNDLTINGTLACKHALNVHSGNGVLNVPPGTSVSATLAVSTTAALNVGTTAGAGVVNQTGGTVTVTRTDGSTGSPKATLVIGNSLAGAGTYNISGGSLVDGSPSGTSPGTGRFDMGQAGGPGVLNISGTGSVLCQNRLQMVLSGGDSTINVTNGSLNIAGELRMGTTNNGTATVNVYGGTVVVGGEAGFARGGAGQIANWNSFGGDTVINNVQLPRFTDGIGTMTISGGTISVTNELRFRMPGSGTVNLNGGVFRVSNMANPTNCVATVNFNGGTLKATRDTGTFIQGGIINNVLAGGAVIDTTNFFVTILSPLLNGGGAGGLTKLGSGRLTIGSAAGTYAGPTLVNQGTLAFNTTNHTGGAIVVSDKAALQVALTNATTMNCSSLTLGTLGASLGGTNTLDLRVGAGNPTVPVVTTPSLAAAGTVRVAVNGSGLTIGTSKLIQYSGAVSGSDFKFELASVSGGRGYVTNNTASQSIDLVITALDIPTFNSVVLNSGNLIISGTNGTANASYRVLASTNLALPLNLWVPVATNNFDINGNFAFTNAVNPAKPAEFFSISLP